MVTWKEARIKRKGLIDTVPVTTAITGGNSKGETPVPIPNTEVKTFNAKNTSLETNWK